MFLMPSHFAGDVCMFIFPFFWEQTYCTNWFLFKMHMSKIIIAYVERNPCRNVETVHFKAMLHSLERDLRSFVLMCLFSVHLCFG